MPVSIDWPRSRPPSRRRLPLLLILLLFIAVIFGGRTAVSYYVDALWYGSFGYAEVFWKTLRLQSTIFTVFTGATFLILFAIFLGLKRAYLTELESGSTIFIGGRAVRLPVESILRLMVLGISLAIALVAGAAMTT